jgi:hypothetical protein
MKKLMLVGLFILLAVGWMAAQNAKTPYDILGAHNNGGRGCAACHAPHSGGRGNGGNIVGTGVSTGGVEGDWHLWGTDVSIITAETLNFGGGYTTEYGGNYTVNFGGAQQWTSTSNGLVGGIAICLSCHDGNVSEGAMMMGQSYEQQAGILATVVGAGQGTTTNALYGTTPIPTLLGNDGGNAGDYLNDHPVGYNANYNALSYPFSTGGLGNWGLTYAVSKGSITWTVAPGSAFASFLNNYTASAVNGMVVDATGTVPFVVCTTCHNQHQMTIYNGGTTQLSEVTAVAGGTYYTYFFVNGPYNPGAKWTPTSAPSTTQFCRQCHFGMTNEAMGNNNVTTAF